MDVFTLDQFLATFPDEDIQVFRLWCQDHTFTSIVLALDMYRAVTGIKIEYKRLSPF